MPLHKNKEITPEEAMAMELCPECAVDMTERDIEHEIARHWPLPFEAGAHHDEARKRVALLKEYAEIRKQASKLR
jgi:hypothetical protein